MRPKQGIEKKESDIANIQRVSIKQGIGKRKDQTLPYLKNLAQARYREDNPNLESYRHGFKEKAKREKEKTTWRD